jgi:AraC family transcriptional regulator of adaptative response / DNA-3-methyladenine glycosylase II
VRGTGFGAEREGCWERAAAPTQRHVRFLPVGALRVRQNGRMDTELDHERCYRAVASRDARFDGAFYTAVRTTGIYCRPSCPAITPRRGNVGFFRTAAAAQQAGYRACRRCRPDAVPGSAEWNVRGDVVGRAMRLVADGAVDRVGVAGVAAALGYSQRHLTRLVSAELGAGLQAIARTQRAHTARLLLESTDLPATEVAWAAGFGSVRSFNDTISAVYGASPSALRGRLGRSGRAHGRPAAGGHATGDMTHAGQGLADRAPGAGAPGSAAAPPGMDRPGAAADQRGAAARTAVGFPVTVRLAARAPIDVAGTLAFLGLRAVPGLEAWDGRRYRRSLVLPHGHGTVACSPVTGGVLAEFRLHDLRDLSAAVARVRRLLDLDADPEAVGEVLGRDPLLADLVAARPGLRVPGGVDPHEILVRAIVGQQVSVAGARTLVGRLVAAHGAPLALPDGALERAFPTPDAIAALDPGVLPMPRARACGLVSACQRLVEGTLVLDAGADRQEAAAGLQQVAGIGPWTAGYLAMRGLGDPDVWLSGDLGVRRAMVAGGADDRPAAVADRVRAWRPWRSYAVVHLWAGAASADRPDPATRGARR